MGSFHLTLLPILIGLVSCQPATMSPDQPQPATPGQTTPGQATPGQTIPAEPGATSAPSAAFSLHGTVVLGEQPFANAAVFLVLGQPGVTPANAALDVQTGVTTDSTGRFSLPLKSALPADSLFLIAVKRGPTTLYSLPMNAQQVAENALATVAPYDTDIRIGLVTTILGKKFTPKLAELALSRPDSAAARQRCRDGVARVAGLQPTVTTVLAQSPKDQRLLTAYAAIGTQPDAAAIESLANIAMNASDLQDTFRGTLDSLHQGVVRNMLDSGALFTVSPWLYGFEVPQVVRDGVTTPTIRFQGKTDTVAATTVALNAGAVVPEMISRINLYLGNTLITLGRVDAPGGGGGGGGGGGAAPPPLPQLAGSAR